jgi:hypothetical protein
MPASLAIGATALPGGPGSCGPLISARVSGLICGITGSGVPSLPKRAVAFYEERAKQMMPHDPQNAKWV